MNPGVRRRRNEHDHHHGRHRDLLQGLGQGQPIVFSHGWPLSSDDWDNQMLFFLSQGYRVIAHDRRGHGRSTQTPGGHDLDHYADDLFALIEHLDLHDAIHIGHSTGGGEVVRSLGAPRRSRASKAAIISAVPPLMVQTDANPKVCPRGVRDLRPSSPPNRSESTAALPRARSTTTTSPASKSSKPSSRTGGARA